MQALQSSLAYQLDERYCKKIPYKLAEYKKLNVDEFIFDDILRNSGVHIKDITSDVYCKLHFLYFLPEVAAFSQTVSKILQYVIISSKQLSQKANVDKIPVGSKIVKKNRIPNSGKNSKPKKSSSNILASFVAALTVITFVIFILGAYVGAFDSLMINRLAKSPKKVTEPVKPLDELPQQELLSEELEPAELHDEQSQELSLEELPEELLPEESSSEPLAEEKVEPVPPIKKKVIPIAKSDVYTGYDTSQEILNNDGLCEFTVDNTRNNMPVYVRIWDMKAKQPVRAFTIAQGEKFTALNLSPSTYEIRYI